MVAVLSSPTEAPAGDEEETGLGPNPGKPPSPFLTDPGTVPSLSVGHWGVQLCPCSELPSWPLAPGLLL